MNIDSQRKMRKTDTKNDQCENSETTSTVPQNDNIIFDFQVNYQNIVHCIDDDYLHSVCFRESLNIFSKNNLNTGKFSVNIGKDKDTYGIIYVVYVSLEENINGFKHTSTAFGRVTPKFITLEERRIDSLMFGNKKIERGIYLLNEGDNYSISLSFFDGKIWQRSSLDVPIEGSTVLMGEAANYLYVRYLAQTGKRITARFLTLLFDGSLHTCEYDARPSGMRQVGRDQMEVHTVSVKRVVLNPKGKMIVEWAMTTGAGYILEEKREIPTGSVKHPFMRYNDEKEETTDYEDIDEEELLMIAGMEGTPPTGENIDETPEEFRTPEDEAGTESLPEKPPAIQTVSETTEPTEEIKEENSGHGFEEVPAEDQSSSVEGMDSHELAEENCLVDLPVTSEGPSTAEGRGSLVGERTSDEEGTSYATYPTVGTEDLSDEYETPKPEEEGTRADADGEEDATKPDDGDNAPEESTVADEGEELTDEGSAHGSRASEKLSDKSSEETIHVVEAMLSDRTSESGEVGSGSEAGKDALEKRKQLEYDRYAWPDATFEEEESEEEEVVRTLDDILADYERVREDCAKIRKHARQLSSQGEKWRRKLRGPTMRVEAPDWGLADGVRCMAVHKKCVVSDDGKVDQNEIPLEHRWREDPQLVSAYVDRKVAFGSASQTKINITGVCVCHPPSRVAIL